MRHNSFQPIALLSFLLLALLLTTVASSGRVEAQRMVSPNPAPFVSTAETSATPTPSLIATETLTVGLSVKQQPIRAYRIGRGARVVVVGAAIHGSEQNTAQLVSTLASLFVALAGPPPDDVSLYLLPVLNPDGFAEASRLNANGVDLNRNWETNDWQAAADGPYGLLPNGGGSAPFSEPETAALSAWLLALRDEASQPLVALFYHAAVPPSGLVQPGYRLVEGTPQPDAEAAELAQSFASEISAIYAPIWTSYPITGETIHWCTDHQIQCFDVELPDANELGIDALKHHADAILHLLVRVGAR